MSNQNITTLPKVQKHIFFYVDHVFEEKMADRASNGVSAFFQTCHKISNGMDIKFPKSFYCNVLHCVALSYRRAVPKLQYHKGKREKLYCGKYIFKQSMLNYLYFQICYFGQALLNYHKQKRCAETTCGKPINVRFSAATGKWKPRKFRKCRCNNAHYCRQKCQKKHWHIHQLICQKRKRKRKRKS